MLKINTSPHLEKNSNVVTETYDLLSNNSLTSMEQNMYNLLRPSSVQDLREIRFRSFLPVLKNNISNLSKQKITITIYPMMFMIDRTTGQVMNENLSAFTLTNFANNYDMQFGSEQYTIEFYGNIDEVFENINEKIGSYCSNFKPSGTFCAVNNTKTIRYTLFDGASSCSIEDFYNRYNPDNDIHTFRNFFSNGSNVISVNKIFSKFRFKNKNPPYMDNIELYTQNMIFPMKNFNNLEDHSLMMLTFCIDMYTDIDLISVSNFRQLNNIIEYAKINFQVTPPSDYIPYYCTTNECISTSNKLYDNLVFANYLYNGLDLILKSPQMKNLSNIISINGSTANIYMKSFEVTPTTKSIQVYLTDNKNNNISKSYLEELYSALIIEIDYVYDTY